MNTCGFCCFIYICCLIDLSFGARVCLISSGMLLLMLLICVFGGFVWHLLVLAGWWVLVMFDVLLGNLNFFSYFVFVS